MNAFQRSLLALPLLLAATGCDTDRQDAERPAAERLALACFDVCVDDEDCDRCDAPEGVLTFDAESALVVAELLGLEAPPEVAQVSTDTSSFAAPVDVQAASDYGLMCAYTAYCRHPWRSVSACVGTILEPDYGMAYQPFTGEFVIVACVEQ